MLMKIELEKPSNSRANTRARKKWHVTLKDTFVNPQVTRPKSLSRTISDKTMFLYVNHCCLGQRSGGIDEGVARIIGLCWLSCSCSIKVTFNNLIPVILLCQRFIKNAFIHLTRIEWIFFYLRLRRLASLLHFRRTLPRCFVHFNSKSKLNHLLVCVKNGSTCQTVMRDIQLWTAAFDLNSRLNIISIDTQTYSLPKHMFKWLYYSTMECTHTHTLRIFTYPRTHPR